MERELCVVFDIDGNVRLALKKGTMAELDSYTSKQFESNADIKKRYKKEIEFFLNENKEKLQNINKHNYRCRIAIVLPEKIGGSYIECQKAVLLKKHIVIFKEYIKNERVMKRFARKFSYLFSEMMLFYINSRWSINGTKTKIDEWLKELKNDKVLYYKFLRDFLSFYDNLSKDKMINMNFPTIDEFYELYKTKKEMKTESKQSFEHEMKEDFVIHDENKSFIVNGECYTIDELEQFDLDDHAEYESDIIPDGLGYAKTFR